MAKTLKEKRIKKHLRVRAKISGTEAKPRLNVFKSNKQIYVQVIDDVNGKTIASTSSQVLKLKSNNVANSKLVGKEIAKKAIAKGIKEVVFDRGGYVYHGKVKAIADGAREEGLKF